MAEKSLKELKEQAKTTAGTTGSNGKDKTVDNITFKSGSGTEAVFKVLERASKPLTKKAVVERAAKSGEGHKESRMGTVLGWLATRKIALKDAEGNYTLAPRDPKAAKAEEPAEVKADADESKPAAPAKKAKAAKAEKPAAPKKAKGTVTKPITAKSIAAAAAQTTESAPAQASV